MALVVFFRAVNVGGHQKFQPAKIAGALATFGVVNIGAAGTFVVRANPSQTKLRSEILRHLPFQPELMICPARDVLTLAHAGWFADAAVQQNAGRFVSVMQKSPSVQKLLPILYPEGDRWEVRIFAVVGRFALSLRRPGPKGVYPNAAVEKQLGISATTRGWATIQTICDILEDRKATTS